MRKELASAQFGIICVSADFKRKISPDELLSPLNEPSMWLANVSSSSFDEAKTMGWLSDQSNKIRVVARRKVHVETTWKIMSTKWPETIGRLHKFTWHTALLQRRQTTHTYATCRPLGVVRVYAFMQKFTETKANKRDTTIYIHIFIRHTHSFDSVVLLSANRMEYSHRTSSGRENGVLRLW